MTRARATALALVNWKGVFYERYQLDRHVTALEGANGSGKTTVMIAAYIVLLPDMTRLRFTNLGESGGAGGDRGIWGRLGHEGRPSYAAMEIAIPGGEPLVAGIHLARKADPSVELTPFLVTGIRPDTRLRDVLLVQDGEHEAVPELGDLRAAITRLGGQLEVFATAKDYFAALFDRGVMPLRMATDEDRNKYSDMLRTSMGGGISRALTTDLRAFVLKEETGLGDALSRMRENLDACHRTRIEVGEARRLEHEVRGVYEAGQAMFAAAMLATRAEAEERARSEIEARRALEEAAQRVRELDDAMAEATARRDGHSGLVAEARAASERAAARCERTVRAHALARRLDALERELAGAAESAKVARAAQRAAESARELRRRERDRTRDAYDRAAGGLSDLQSGLEELHRNAHALRHARRRLSEAREACADPTLDPQRLDAAIERTRTRLLQIDVDRARFDRDRESIAVRREEHARAFDALARIVSATEPPPLAENAHDEARRALARLANLEALPSRIAELSAEYERSSRLAERQAAVRARAARLGIAESSGPSALAAERRLALAEAELHAADDAARAAQAAASEARRAGDAAHVRTSELGKLAARRSAATSIAERLEAALGLSVRSRDALERVRLRLEADRSTARALAAEAGSAREQRLREAAALESPAYVHPDLVRIKDEIDGELLAARFEDADVDEAARIEATLGPLADAIVVLDPERAAQRLRDRPREMASVWLVATDASFDARDPGSPPSRGTDVVIPNARGVRITRVPDRPTLGRRARERRAADLRAEAGRMEGEGERWLSALQTLEGLARDASRLPADVDALEGDDPTDAIMRARAHEEAAREAERDHLAAASAARQRAAAERPRVAALRALLGDAFLLDPPDHAARAASLHVALHEATRAREELRRVAEARGVLSELVEALRTPPPPPDQVSALSLAREESSGERERLFRASEALEDLVRSRHALGLEGVDAALAERETIVPALKAQLAQAQAAARTEESALGLAEAVWEAATRASQKAEGECASIEAHRRRLDDEIAAEGVGDRSNEALAAARQAMVDCLAEQTAQERNERALATEVALLRERRAHAMQAVRGAEAALAAEQRLAEPAAAEWARVARGAEAAGVLRDAVGTRFEQPYAERSSAQLRPEVSSRAEVLVDRLTAARGGNECVPIASAAKGSAGRATSSDACLAAWLRVREWVRQRLPGELAELAEPLAALERLRDHLGGIEQHLARQESDVRGVSGDVARGIDVQLRKATHQVQKLNRNLVGVTFGSISGLRVQARRIDRMDQVLGALREGAMQKLLFQPALPIEEALDEIFRRYGGGRSGGKRILDYREYVALAVEIRRRGADAWEPASSTRLSTGEAIGVGSALIMVILTEWEASANLLRRKRGAGSLRFLLLDEANRLSQDNLAVLFDLCRNLDVQLLIAAPEVARAEGNTTFRLVRRITEEGGEEVLVSGRRTVSPLAKDAGPTAGEG